MIDVVFPYASGASSDRTLDQFVRSPLVRRIAVVHDGSFTGSLEKCDPVRSDVFASGKNFDRILGTVKADSVLIVSRTGELTLGDFALERFAKVLAETGAGMVYSDFISDNGKRIPHSVNDYQFGSIRDNFDFGMLQMYSSGAIRSALKKYGTLADVRHGALYDVRLKVSIDHPLFHIQEYLYTTVETDGRKSGEKQFDYVDPRNQEVQKEMETVVTEYLKRVNVYLAPRFKSLPKVSGGFPVEASVIIPVRNRERTIRDAVTSALKQKTDFDFNVIVVDNHSSDKTSMLLAELARSDPRVFHMIPVRDDLGIGGCWNEAVRSQHCGRYAVQLDSDDLYSGETTLQTIVETFRSGEYAMVIGAYRLVNMQLEEIPPGVIDHKEWSTENGRNNALRINGLGAPRAFVTHLLRENPIPNVSYGEDYAIGLRLSREYQIGRIFEPIYLCRRWEGNTDSALSVEQMNRNDSYKDKIRTIEMLARQTLNARGRFEPTIPQP